MISANAVFRQRQTGVGAVRIRLTSPITSARTAVVLSNVQILDSLVPFV
jgi:hypothetical protein